MVQLISWRVISARAGRLALEMARLVIADLGQVSQALPPCRPQILGAANPKEPDGSASIKQRDGGDQAFEWDIQLLDNMNQDVRGELFRLRHAT